MSQLRLPTVAAPITYGCSPRYLRLQPGSPTVAAPITYGCSLDHLRLQAFEAERLSLQCEHSMAGSRRDGTECDVSREKMEVLKGAYYALQAESGQRIASLEAQLHGQQERLGTYDKMEHELDAAVASAGGGGGGSGPRIVVPTSAQRRLDQCVRLSAQLLAAQVSMT